MKTKKIQWQTVTPSEYWTWASNEPLIPSPTLLSGLIWQVLLRGSLYFCSCTTWFLDLDDSDGINRAWLYKEPKVSVLQAHTQLVQKGEWRVLDLGSLEARVQYSATLPTLCIYWKTRMMVQYESLNVIITYRSGTVNSNTVNSKFHLIRSYCVIFFYHFPNISCLKCTVNSNFHLIQSKTLLTNDFELTVPDL